MMIQGYINLFAIVIAATVILQLPIFFILKKKGKGLIRQSSYLLCFWSFFIIVFATIILFNLPFRFDPGQSVLNLSPFQWLREGNIMRRIMTEIRPNILLFIPLGLFIPIVFKRMRKLHMTALIVFTVTLSVEFFQYFIGRSSDIDDLIANLSGGIIGYGIFRILMLMFKNKQWWNKLADEKGKVSKSK